MSYIKNKKGEFTLGKIIMTFLVVVCAFIVSADFFNITTNILGIEDGFQHPNPVVRFGLLLYPYIFIILGLWLSLKVIHKKRFISLITPEDKISWRKIWFGFYSFALIIITVYIIHFLLFPTSYQWNNVGLKEFLSLFMIAIIFVPIQTTAEELLFRGFLLKSVSKIIQNKYILSIIVGTIFGVLHFKNPEMEQGLFIMGLVFLFSGIMLTLITIETNSLEISIGGHIANNLFFLLLIFREGTVLGNIPSLVKADISPLGGLAVSLVIISTFYFITTNGILKRNKKDDKKSSEKGKGGAAI